MKNTGFRKIMENVEKYRDIKPVTTERRRNYFVSELANYHTTKLFKEHLLAMVMTKTEILINKPMYLGLSILELRKILMYEFCYDYLKRKCVKKSKIVLYGYR